MNCLPAGRVRWRRRLFRYDVIVIVDLEKLLLYEVVVGAFFVTQLVNVLKNAMHLSNRFSRAYPKTASGGSKALRFDILDLVDSVVTLFTPLELFIEKVKHRKIKTPHIISS